MNRETLDELLTSFRAKGGSATPRNYVDLPLDQDFVRDVKKDIKVFEGYDLVIDPRIKIALGVQTILGHAQEGHVSFERKHPDASMVDVIKAAGLNLNSVRKQRQTLVDQVYKWVDLALGKRKPSRLTLDNKPLLGAEFLRDHKVEPVEVLRGMVLAGYMDNYQARKRTVDRHPTTFARKPLIIGGGETYLINPYLIQALVGSLRSLGTDEHDETWINAFRDIGGIVDQKGKGIESAYIRREKGPGTSDDMALIYIGRKYGIGAMLGAFVVDAIDTYDKLVAYPEAGGLDEVLAAYIQSVWKHQTGEELVKEHEIDQLIYLSAKSNTPQLGVSSSHRRFVEIPNKQSKPTLLLHLDFVEGRTPPKRFYVGFDRMPSDEFYSAAQSRLNRLAA